MSLSTSSATDRSEGATQAAQRRRGRRMMLIVLAVCAVPVVAAYVAFYLFPPTGRVNYGDLVETKPLPADVLERLDGKPFSIADLRGKWVLVQIDDGACAESCRKKLYDMRQVRTAQGRDMDRVERLWLVTDRTAPAAELAPLRDGVVIARVTEGPLLAAFPAPVAPTEHVYLVDPIGNLVLRFPREADPKKMIKDLQRLLKVSRIG